MIRVLFFLFILTQLGFAQKSKFWIFVKKDYQEISHYSELEKLDLEVLFQSRFLSAFSILANQDEIPKIEKLPFVNKIQKVQTFVRKKITPQKVVHKNQVSDSTNYGLSEKQLTTITIDKLHEKGFFGEGILIGVIDTGFNLEHEAFAGIKVIAERDFINNDSITKNEVGDSPTQDSHGTRVLSVLAGNSVGNLIGVTPKASFVLAKTEIDDQEIRIEEDNWVAALEWADSLGADLVTSSLGYNIFEDGTGYGKDELDGKTSVVAQAAKIAVERGMVVVVGAGNEGRNSPTTILTPADVEEVISVGAVNEFGEITSFSSNGPTSDGRIKPDICAMGARVLTVSNFSDSTFTFSSGTSFSAPLVAGGIALLLELDKTLTPKRVADGLRFTANTDFGGNLPNNTYGYGIADFERLFNFLEASPEDFDSWLVFPNPTSGKFKVQIPLEVFFANFEAKIFNVLGQEVKKFNGRFSSPIQEFSFWENGEERLALGNYFLRIKAGNKTQNLKITLIK
ncbi:MAG: T9SS C-terminal target domain-containing protein [Calditrichaeota bacterium]|nr:MAG: T9SS C-terminal target domain-containing protein [Calditrichota bacterium]